MVSMTPSQPSNFRFSTMKSCLILGMSWFHVLGSIFRVFWHRRFGTSCKVAGPVLMVMAFIIYQP